MPNHLICGLSMHQGNMESRKNLEQKFILQLGSLNPHAINKCISFNACLLKRVSAILFIYCLSCIRLGTLALHLFPVSPIVIVVISLLSLSYCYVFTS